jgi:hypothetical protein
MNDNFGMKMMGRGGQFQLEAKMNELCQYEKSSVAFQLVSGSLRNGGRAS